MLGSSIPAPLVLNDHQVCLFNFYQDGSIKPGMHYGHHLYGEVRKFDAKDRLAAYTLANQVAETGCRAVITVSKHSYQVWVRLHAAEYPHWQLMSQAAFAAEPALLAC